MEEESSDELKAQSERIREAARIQSAYLAAISVVSALAGLAPALCMWVVPKGKDEQTI